MYQERSCSTGAVMPQHWPIGRYVRRDSEPCNGSKEGTIPMAPCTDMVTTWALKGLLCHDFKAYVYTIVVLGPFGHDRRNAQAETGHQLPWMLRRVEPYVVCGHRLIHTSIYIYIYTHTYVHIVHRYV